MVSKTPKRLITPEEEHLGHFQAIGGLCYQWALLDRALLLLIEYLSEMDEKTIACLMSASNDTSKRSEISSRLVVLRVADGPWRNCLLNILSTIQNKMCEIRNRTVHDEWHLGEAEILRVTRAVKSPKNSNQVRELVYEKITSVAIGEIDSFVEDVTTTLIGILIMASEYRKQKKTLQTLEAPRPLLLLYKKYFPMPTQKSAPKPKRQPKPFRQ